MSWASPGRSSRTWRCEARHRSDRGGIILLMVLLAIVVVGVAMVATARAGMRTQQQVLERQRSMQRRFGTLSCQQTLLLSAGNSFAAAERLSGRRTPGAKSPHPSIVTDRVSLGGMQFDLLLGDEDAKANLNVIFHAGGRRDCEQAVSRLSGVFDSQFIALRPAVDSQASRSRPSNRQSVSQAADSTATFGTFGGDSNEEETLDPHDAPPAFRSWGEVFDLASMSRLAGDDRQVAAATRRMTLFGRGQLNVSRADDEAILAVARTVVEDGVARRLLQRLRESPTIDVRLVLMQAVSDEQDRRRLERLLGRASVSFSLWVESTTAQSRHQHYAVQTLDVFGQTRTIEYSFE